MRRHELTDEQWTLIEDMFPRNGQGPGRPWNDHRTMMNAMLWNLATGAPWRDLPERFGPWQSAYDRFSMYRRDGTLDKMIERLQIKLDEQGKIDWELFCVDGSSVRAHRAAAGAKKGGLARPPRMSEDHALGRSRGGWGTKLHIVTDGQGTPLAIRLTPGQAHESTEFEAVLDAVRIPQPVGRPRKRPDAAAGDKAYGVRRAREWLKARRIEDVIPTKSNQQPRENFDREKYRRRNVVERCIGWIKEFRRIATRYEKLAVNYQGMLKLAMMRRYFCVLADTT
ncbi:MAG: IS5 family transposase [Planctomycetota bacterium]